MKMKCYYYISKRGELWGGYCSIVDAEKYDKFYSIYLMNGINSLYVEDIERELKEIEKIEKDEKEVYDNTTEFFEYFIYKDRVEFTCSFQNDYEDWQCSLIEYKNALVGWMKFLKMSRDINSYLEVKINDIEK